MEISRKFYDGAEGFGLRTLFRVGGKNCWGWLLLLGLGRGLREAAESLFCIDLNDVDFGHLIVPVAGNGFEGKAKLAVVAGLERGGGDGLGIDIGLVGADEGEGLGFDLGRELDVVAEEDLDGDAGDGLVAGVADVAVDVGVLAAGDVFGLAHGEL